MTGPRTLEQIAKDAAKWGSETFPGDDLEDITQKLFEEHAELQEAVEKFLDREVGLNDFHEPVEPLPSLAQRRSELLDEVAARKLEEIFSHYWPVTYEAFVANGRVAP